jgi:hypothetical protein
MKAEQLTTQQKSKEIENKSQERYSALPKDKK